MAGPWTGWNHVLKVDPDKPLPAGDTYEDLANTGTDAIAVGGTTGVTREKMMNVIEGVRGTDVPVYVEPSNIDVVVDHDEVAGYLVPTVLNAGTPFWITGAHRAWVESNGRIHWDEVAMEAYIVLNPESDVATYTQADCDLDVPGVRAYATVADRLFNQEIVYVEYSGTLGDPELVAAANEGVSDATLFYGGGIHDYESAREMATHADTIVVGNLAHESGAEAVAETVAGAADA